MPALVWIRTALGVMGILFFSVFFTSAFHAREEYARGLAALQQREYSRAVTHFNRAVHWYSPGSEAVRQSIGGLWQIGTEAEARGDRILALEAFQSLRSSLYAARSLYTPYPEWISKCDDRIAALYALAPDKPSSESPPALESRKNEMLKILKTPTAPDGGWSLVCEAGFLGWITCTVVFILRVFAPPIGFPPRRAVLWGGLLASFYALWILGMLHA